LFKDANEAPLGGWEKFWGFQEQVNRNQNAIVNIVRCSNKCDTHCERLKEDRRGSFGGMSNNMKSEVDLKAAEAVEAIS
jgi:hypothetical protein